MPRWARHAVVPLLPACFHPSYDHPACSPDGVCPSGWHCVQGFCERPGSGDAGGDDAGVDGPGNATFCLGDAVVMACLAQMPAAPLAISSSTMIDSDQPGNCSPDAVGSSAPYCIVAGSSITILGGQTLSAHGSGARIFANGGSGGEGSGGPSGRNGSDAPLDPIQAAAGGAGGSTGGDGGNGAIKNAEGGNAAGAGATGVSASGGGGGGGGGVIKLYQAMSLPGTVSPPPS